MCEQCCLEGRLKRNGRAWCTCTPSRPGISELVPIFRCCSLPRSPGPRPCSSSSSQQHTSTFCLRPMSLQPASCPHPPCIQPSALSSCPLPPPAAAATHEAQVRALLAPPLYNSTPAPPCPGLPACCAHLLPHTHTLLPPARPLQPPKKPESAPFFLPTVAGLSGEPIFDTTSEWSES